MVNSAVSGSLRCSGRLYRQVSTGYSQRDWHCLHCHAELQTDETGLILDLYYRDHDEMHERDLHARAVIVRMSMYSVETSKHYIKSLLDNLLKTQPKLLPKLLPKNLTILVVF